MAELKKTIAVKEPVGKSITEKTPEVKKAPVKKVTEKKPAAKKTVAKKAEVKANIYLQFENKSFTNEDLLKMAKDIWKFDLKNKSSDLKTIELYVKPQENMVYYVMNEIEGSFYI